MDVVVWDSSHTLEDCLNKWEATRKAVAESLNVSWTRAFELKWNPRTWSRDAKEAARRGVFKLGLRRFKFVRYGA